MAGWLGWAVEFPLAGAIIMASILVSFPTGSKPPVGAEVVSPHKVAS
jgi:hypothetical protein